MRNWMQLGPISLLAASGLLFALTGCEEITEQCNLECPEEGILKGNASISGVASVDSFFGAVVNFTSTADRVSGNVEAQLARIRASLELDADADADAIVTAIQSKFRLQGGLRIKYQPARCAVSARATVEATARCEGEVTPPMVSVECKGTCELDASAEVECDASATLECVGTAPNFECEGACEGTCELSVAAECAGTCNGTCDGTCTVEGPDGQCAGRCDGNCEGRCELSGGATCAGQCRGECTYEPGSVGCEADATARCRATGEASIECSGRCEGEVTPPMASAECQASAKAEAQVNVDCTPPSIDVEYAFAAGANAEVRAQFEVFLVRFRTSISAIAAELARADVIVAAGGDLIGAADVAVRGSINGALDGDLSFKQLRGLECAVSELDNVEEEISRATTRLENNVSVATELTTTLTTGS